MVKRAFAGTVVILLCGGAPAAAQPDGFTFYSDAAEQWVTNEYPWLDNLPRSPIPVAYIWGLMDTVNPIRIANHAWNTYLNDREAESSLWVMPTG